MKKRYRKLIALILCLVLTLPSRAMAAQPANPELSEKLTKASILLSRIMQDQYEAAVDNIKETADREGYDYPLTAEAFTEMGSPYKDMDWITLIATASSINSRAKGTGEGKAVDLKSVEYIKYSYEIESITEPQMHKIEEYEQVSGNMYKKTGFHYSDKEEDLPVYEEADDGLYEKVGERHVKPDTREIPYMDVTFKVLVPDDLFAVAGVEKDEWFEDDIERRKVELTKTTDNDVLRSNVFIKIPKNAMGAAGWIDAFLDAVGYTGDMVRIDGNAVANIAATLADQVPYEWGGKAKAPGYDTTWWSFDEAAGLQKGLDCSGFVQWTYITAGFPKEITDTLLSTAIMDRNYESISDNDIRVGDIGLNMSRKIGHCGIYAGDGKWWHCSSAAGTVVLSDGAGLGFSKVIRPVDMEGELFYRSLQVYYPESGEETRQRAAEEVIKAKAEEEEENQEKQKAKDVADSVKEAEKEQPAKEEKPVPDSSTPPPVVPKVKEPEKPDLHEEAEAQQTVQVTMTAPEPEKAAPVVINTPVSQSASEDDVMLLAQLITHEALNQGLNGWIAVGEVVRNRVNSSLFPASYREVILQKGQFTNAGSLSAIKPRQEIIDTARAVMEGRLSVLGSTQALYFRNAYGKTGNWGKHAVYKKIGQHTFYLQ